MIVTSGDVSVNDCSGYGVVAKSFATNVVDGTVTPASLYVYAADGGNGFYNKNGDAYTNVIDNTTLPTGYDENSLKSFTSIGDDLVVDMTTLQLELVSEGKPNVNVLVCEAGSESTTTVQFQHVGNYIVTVAGKPVNNQLTVNNKVVTYTSLFGETSVVTSGVYTGSNPKDLLSTVDQTVLYNMFSSSGYPQPNGGVEELKAKLSGYDALLKELCKRSFYITSNATDGTVDEMFNDYVSQTSVYKPVPDDFNFKTSDQQAWVAADYQHFDMKLYSLQKKDKNFAQLCSGNTGITNLDLSLWQVGTVTNMSGMFSGCESLQTLNLSNWNTRNVTDMDGMFIECSSLQTLNLSGWNTSKVELMNHMFYDCTNLQSLDLSSFDTSKVGNMRAMFASCSSLQTLDLTSFNTSNVEYIDYMFEGCSSLQTLNLSNFDTSKVGNIRAMFEGCTSLQTLDLSNFSLTSEVETSYVFIGCMSLTTVYIDNCNDTTIGILKDLLTGLTEQTVNRRKCLQGTFTGARMDVPDDFNFQGYNPNPIEVFLLPYFDMQKYITDKGPTSLANLFEGNTQITTLDLQWWQTDSATDMSNMFKDCTRLTTINLSRLFTISATTNVTGMFANCPKLTTVYYGPNSKSKLQPLLTGFTDNTTLQAFVKQ